MNYKLVYRTAPATPGLLIIDGGEFCRCLLVKLSHQVERVEIKDVRLPVQLQRAMAAEAEAAREARAKVGQEWLEEGEQENEEGDQEEKERD